MDFFFPDPIWPQEYKLYYIVPKASATAPGMCLCDLYLLQLNFCTHFWASVLPSSNFCKLPSCQYLCNWPLFCFLNHVYVEGSQNKQCTTNYITLFDLLIKNPCWYPLVSGASLFSCEKMITWGIWRVMPATTGGIWSSELSEGDFLLKVSTY